MMEKKRTPRRGSALIMVLGILAVLLLMAIAFSAFVRTERSGSTNLKNGDVARDSLYTALGRVMEAIDLSFDSPLGDDPAPAWPHPWIASHGSFTNDYFQSAALGDDEAPSALVLTEEITKYLSPAQLALARSARCNWAPILGSVNASRARSDGKWRGGLQGILGRPSGDDLLGRYAFIALDTTGLADINMTGVANTSENLKRRQATSGGDTLRLVIPSSVKASDNTDLTPFVKNPSSFAGLRPVTEKSSAGGKKTMHVRNMLNSLADARARKATAFEETVPSVTGDDATGNEAIYPVDLFAGFSPSLTDPDPEGNPKIVLPTRSKLLSSYKKQENLLFLFRRTFRAMVGIFARGRVAAGENAQSYSKDYIPIYSGHNGGKQYNLPRSHLATVALMDGLDADFIPGRSVSPAAPYWGWTCLDVNNPSVEVSDKDGKTKTVQEPLLPYDDHRDYPCTESAPLLSSVYAYIEIDPSKTTEHKLPVDDPDNWTKTYHGTLYVGAAAICQNRTMESSKHQAKLEIKWEVMPGLPNGTVSGYTGTAVKDKVEWKNADDFGNGTANIDWDDFFTLSGEASSDEVTVDDGSEEERILLAQDSKPIMITCKWNSSGNGGGGGGGGGDDFGNGGDGGGDDFGGGGGDDFGGGGGDDFGGGGDDFGNGGGTGGGGGTVTGDWYPPVRYSYDAAQNGTEDKDVFVPVRVCALVYTGSKNNTANRIQEVPGKQLGGYDGSNKDWWIRVDAGVWHGKDSTFGKPDKFDSAEGHAVGWAFSTVPAFGFDTTGLATQRNGNEESPSDKPVMHFWLNNVLALTGGVDDFGNPAGNFESIMADFFQGSDPHGTAISETGASAFGVPVWNYAQLCWLFSVEKSSNNNTPDLFPNVTDWMDTSASSHRPDMLHALATPQKLKSIYKNNWKDHASFLGTGFNRVNGQYFPKAARLGSELYSRIPANGYETVADLGTVMCGPYETLSPFKTWRFNSDKADFHPVLDYFTFDEDRYPTTDQIRAVTKSDGEVEWDKLPGGELLPAVHNGRVNLNAPPLVECSKIRRVASKAVGVRGVEEQEGRLNPYPIATVLNGAPYPALNDNGSITTNNLKEAQALEMAAELCRSLEQADENIGELWAETHRFSGVSKRPVVRSLSFLGRGGNDQNSFLRTFVDNATPAPLCDYEREGILRGIVDGFSTRGQTYLVIIRADAYSPKFGENEAVDDGTTLATTHAVVELFRDPSPVRLPDGSLPSDASGKPVVYHNWYVRSFRVF